MNLGGGESKINRAKHSDALIAFERPAASKNKPRFELKAAVHRERLASLEPLSLRESPARALRRNLTACDAAYMALAEALDATFLTRDARVGKSAGHKADVEVV